MGLGLGLRLGLGLGSGSGFGFGFGFGFGVRVRVRVEAGVAYRRSAACHVGSPPPTRGSVCSLSAEARRTASSKRLGLGVGLG